MTRLLPVLVGSLALLCASAFADGVPLITPGPALPANNAVEQFWKTGDSRFVKLHSIILNQAAFGANVVTAVIDGKLHRFVGSVLPPPALAVTWRGYERLPGPVIQDFSSITLRKEPNGTVSGFVYLTPSRRLDIDTPAALGSTVLIETATH